MATILFDNNIILPETPMYRYVSYWRSWRRILMMQEGWYLEVELTPVNVDYADSWLKTEQGWLYWHCTWSRAPIAKDLPKEWRDQMVLRLGEEKTKRLLTADLWAEIDWPKEAKGWDVSKWLRDHGENGGLPLTNISKGAKSAVIEPLTDDEKKLQQALQWHDWSFEYSDDVNAYRRGSKSKEEITALLQSIPVERARELWNAWASRYASTYWRCPV